MKLVRDPAAPRARARTRCRRPSRAAARATRPERADRGHELRPVDEREPFLRLQANRLEPGARRAPRRRAASSPSNHASPSPTSGSARWASGARSPLAPTDPRLGTCGRTPRLRHSTSSSTVSTRAPEFPFASAFARSTIAARTTSSGYGSPTPHAWLRSSRSWSSSVSSSGIDAETKRPKPVLTPYVCSRAPWAARSTTSRAASIRPRASVGQRDRRSLDRDLPDVLDGEVLAAQRAGLDHAASVALRQLLEPSAGDRAERATASSRSSSTRDGSNLACGGPRRRRRPRTRRHQADELGADHLDAARPASAVDALDDLVQRGRLPVLDVHAHLREPARGRSSPSARTPGKPPPRSRTTTRSPARPRRRPRRLTLNAISGRARRRSPRPLARPARRAEVGRELARVDPPLQLRRAAAPEERRPAARRRARRTGTPAARAPRRSAAPARAPSRVRARRPRRIGTTGTTSAAPIRGCAPSCRAGRCRSRAHATPASSASTSAASSPTSVKTLRW